MTSASSEPSRTPPDWPHCGLGATPENPIGCRGIHVAGYTACLAHLNETDRAAYLATLVPGANIDHRGTPVTEDLLRRLLDTLRDPTSGHPHLGIALFSEVSFSGGAWFGGASFFGEALFEGASFSSGARFSRASFSGGARFSEASFAGDAWFDGASFSSGAWFDRSSFSGDARFGEASFSSSARFSQTSFAGDALFDGVRFEAPWLGPLACGGQIRLNGAVFGAPVTVEIAARTVTCVRTQWASIATIRLRYAELDLSDAVLEYPLTVTARPTPFPGYSGGLLPETELRGQEPGVRLTSVGGVDAAQLVLHDIDLSVCRFVGAIHLDQLRVDGWCTFAETPSRPRWYRRSLWRWSPRRTLAEEHHWRAQAARPALTRGWTPPPDTVAVLQPAALAALYRQVRKSLEDGKNEPDAADFYFGEMEMRRHDASRSAGERVLLTIYWALSGYGLRSIRALACLGAAMTASLLALMLWGLPTADPKPEITGRQVAVGQDINLTTDTPDPTNPDGPWAKRLTTERFEKALRVVINSVVFRSSGADLTTTGTYTEMASRITEPVLLGLAVLAIRSRVKR